jgi:hypothetical protein
MYRTSGCIIGLAGARVAAAGMSKMGASHTQHVMVGAALGLGGRAIQMVGRAADVPFLEGMGMGIGISGAIQTIQHMPGAVSEMFWKSDIGQTIQSGIDAIEGAGEAIGNILPAAPPAWIPGQGYPIMNAAGRLTTLDHVEILVP